ncbi:MAG: TRAM domain-containing protein, partial [Desulfobulbales bacterium]|nr:TRAM domain-containing protein [Desulfobulbales bacterium]
QATMQMLAQIRYHGVYSFKYSDRPQARAVSFDGKVDEQTKADRLRLLQARQNEITLQRNREYVGSVQAVMVEGKSKNVAGQWSGRTTGNIIVNFDGPALSCGQEVQVKITEGLKNSLRGAIV